MKYSNVQPQQMFLIPGNPLRFRKNDNGTYYPTAWELLESDPEAPYPSLPDDAEVSLLEG